MSASGPDALEDRAPPGPISRVSSLTTITQGDQGDEHPVTSPRRGSTVSHVGVEFFDPAGFQDLRRTLTRESTQESSGPSEEKPSFSSCVVALTGFTGGDGTFGLEKTLRHIVSKYDGFPRMYLNKPCSLFKK